MTKEQIIKELQGEEIKRLKAMGVDGKYSLYWHKKDGVIYWFKVPNEANLSRKETIENLIEYYDEKGGVE